MKRVDSGGDNGGAPSEARLPVTGTTGALGDTRSEVLVFLGIELIVGRRGNTVLSIVLVFASWIQLLCRGVCKA